MQSDSRYVPEELRKRFADAVPKQNMGPLYAELAALAEIIVCEAYEKNNLAPESPVDINLVAEKYNMSISEQPLTVKTKL